MVNQSENPNRVTTFRNQRVIATFAFFTLALVATTSVLWSHIESVMGEGTYGFLAKAGLLLLPAVALILTCWELFVDDIGARRVHRSHPTVVRLVNWCFWMSWLLLIAEVVHSGAVLKYESSSKERVQMLKSVSEGQAAIVSAGVTAAITSSGEAAQKLNGVGQHNTARRALGQGKEIGETIVQSGQESLKETAEKTKPSTFLPDWYVNGGMYALLPSLAALVLAITMAFARAAQPHVDRDDNGTPDVEEVQPVPQAPQRPQPLGFATPAPQPSNQTTPGQNFTVGPKN